MLGHARLGEPGAVAAGQEARIWGWGATCTGNEGACRSPVLKVATTRAETLESVDHLGGSAILARTGDGIAAGGDSGGPMTATSPVDGQQYQVGVSSTSNRSTWCAYTNVTLYRDWILAVAGV
ncbi:trypsin-like serine protease [Actinosynnema mirum]|uniref:trypsin-like serine protease n=1 Tax=Actinosynnema mirum TaxID=40567 RepID=UPI00019AB5EB|nr:trypsin-like serine protease [Actinosynnema mirum]